VPIIAFLDKVSQVTGQQHNIVKALSNGLLDDNIKKGHALANFE